MLSLPPAIIAFKEDIYLNTSEIIVGSFKKNTKLISAVRCQGGAYLGGWGRDGRGQRTSASW